MRIAIVDDIASERTLLRDRLEQQLGRRGVHADLTEFENGETFLKAAKERPFTVLFLDIYMDRDIKAGVLTEEKAQELIDHFVMKLPESFGDLIRTVC